MNENFLQGSYFCSQEKFYIRSGIIAAPYGNKPK